MSTSVLELNSLPTDGRSVFDGKASIEHQIEIYVTDLFDVTDKQDISLGDVIAGLRYVMDYRIRGLRMPHLDSDLMQRLAEGLILHMNQTDGHWLKRRLTQEANDAFILFSEFLEEIDEFGDAIGKKEVSELRGALKLEKRARKDHPEDLQKAAKSIVAHLTEYPQFADWHDLVPEEHVQDVKDVLSSTANALEKPKLPNKGLLRPPPALYFDRPPEAVLRMFRTSINDGLPSSAIPDLADHYGKNSLPSPPKPSTVKMIVKQLTDFMVLILIAATITTACVGEEKSSIVLAVVILLNTVIGFTQEYKANKALEALTSLGVPMAQVIRDGRQEVIESAALVPGDVVVLEEGESVPADLRLVEVSQLEIVESILTGESVGVLKATERIRARTRKLPLGDCKGSAFMSTVVSRGRGKGVVVRTGEQTEIGKISRAITRQPQQVTQIQRKLDRLGKWLVAIALSLSALIVIIGLAWKTDPNELLHTGIALAVSVIPEGLVAVVTVTMALGVRRMADKSAIVRTLSSVETLGSVTVVCSDKTGTLTEGKMGASQLWTADDGLYSFTNSTSLDPNVGCAVRTSSNASKTHSARPIGSSGAAETKLVAEPIPVEAPVSIEKSYTSVPSHLFTTLMISSLCNNAAVVKDAETSQWKGVGDPTEVALVVAAAKAGFPKEWFLEQQGFEKIGEQAFDSDRKLMSVVYAIPKAGVALVLAKGAPEEVLARCTNQLPNPPENMKEPLDIAYGTAPGCTPLPLSEPFVHLVSDQSRRMADGGLRVLGLAMKCVPLRDSTVDPVVIAEAEEATCANPDHAEKDFSFTGLIGLIDPPRAGVKESVAKCNAAGVRVVMITGDHIATATAIATELGIFKPGVPNMCRAIKGVELDLLSDEAMADLSPFPNVFARVSPDNKLKIVQALQSRKHLAAMTGDGVNDAPAIKTADIGIAMGITGTEITKQAADIVLANDDFNTIVFAIEEGRRVYDNILKFCVYLLSCNFAEILLFLITACINVPMPFTTMMILWANIIADIPPAMSLGVEPQEKNIMKRKPRPKDEGVLTYMTATIVILQASVMSLTTVILYLIDLGFDKVFLGNNHGYPEEILRDKQSLAFVTLTTMQLLQSFLSRSVYDSVFVTGVTGNKWMVGAFFLSYGLMLMGLFVQPLADFLSLHPVNTGIAWVQVFAVFAFQLLCSELIKFGARRYRDRGVNTRRQQYEGVNS